jgi:hypothetical protein
MFKSVNSANFVLDVSRSGSGCEMSITSSNVLIYKATFDNKTRTLNVDFEFYLKHIDKRQTSRINLHLAENKTTYDLLEIPEFYWDDLLADIETYP